MLVLVPEILASSDQLRLIFTSCFIYQDYFSFQSSSPGGGWLVGVDFVLIDFGIELWLCSSYFGLF